MGRQGHIDFFGILDDGVGEEIPELALFAIEAELLPSCHERNWFVVEVKEGKEFGVISRARGTEGALPHSCASKARGQCCLIERVTIGEALVHKKDCLIGDERTGEIVEPREIGSENQR